MRKLLLIAYHFPPLTTSGMYRSLQFARYLPRYGWKPVVLTVDPASVAGAGPLDTSPLVTLPEGTRVLRAAATNPLRAALRIRDRLWVRPNGNGASAPPNGPPAATWRDWVSDFFSVPDRQAGWIGPAARAALAEENIDAVYSSSPPASAHLAALVLSRSRGLPWIADFRDPWISNDFTTLRSTGFLDPLDRWLERLVVRGATRVVANTDELRGDFARRYEDDEEKFVTITNGFDPEEMLPEAEAARPGAPVTITHAGTLYGRRDPTAFLEALAGLLARGEIGEDRLRVEFLGTTAGAERWAGLLADPRLARVVRFEPKVPRAEALRRLASSDLLLLIQTGTDLQVPRKLYEYVAIGRPILALVSGGATECLVRREHLGWLVRPDDPGGIAETLRRVAAGERPPLPPRPERFDFRLLTAKLARVLEEVAG